MKKKRTRKSRNPTLKASDGLRARDNGAWAREKLEFLERFAPPALKVAQRKLTRHVLDLFAGPGINMLRGSTTELEGSPLRALALHADGDTSRRFTHATFVNRNRADHRTLQERVSRRMTTRRSLIPAANVRCVHGDANELLPELLAGIHQKAYVFAFAEITAP